MNVLLISKNDIKLRAVQRAFHDVFHPVYANVFTEKAKSDVADTPTSDDEAIKGCLNRISNVSTANYKDVQYIVSLEGTLTTNSYDTFVCGWAVVLDTVNNRQGIGCSAKVQVPEEVIKAVSPTISLAKAVENYYATDMGKYLGANGVITDNKYNRAKEFQDAITCGLGYILNEDNYK